MEQWKDIPGYEGIYQASTYGRIRTHENKTTYTERHGVRHWKQRIMKQKYNIRPCGKYDARVCLWKDGKEKTMLVSRLIAQTWCEGYSPELTVNHIDGNPSNNKAENLEWVTRADNIRAGFADGLMQQIACKVIESDGTEHHFVSLASASRYLGKGNGFVSNMMKKHGGVIVLRDKIVTIC